MKFLGLLGLLWKARGAGTGATDSVVRPFLAVSKRYAVVSYPHWHCFQQKLSAEACFLRIAALGLAPVSLFDQWAPPPQEQGTLGYGKRLWQFRPPA